MTNHQSSSTTTYASSSSLAAAAKAAAAPVVFESCFAQGLDLSEFGATTESKSTNSCASAALLQQVEQRRLTKERNAIEEERLEAGIQERTRHLKNNKMNAVSLALVSMHQSDDKHRVGKAANKKSNIGPKKNHKKKQQQQRVTKKAKTTKFRRSK